MKNTIKKAYKSSKNIYDDALTQTKFWWKLYNQLFWAGVDDTVIAKRVLDAIPPDFSGELLDIPVGTAVFTAEKYAALPFSKITCVDYSEDMLSQARIRFDKRHISNIECMQGDVGRLPFEDNRFDMLVSMNGFHAFPDKEKAFAETYRVLKKGGVFSGCFYIREECRRTDFLVRHFLSPKGWFTPPFQSYSELKYLLEKMYAAVKISNERSIAYFQCIK